MTTAAFRSTWYASETLEPTSDNAVNTAASSAQVVNATCGECHFGWTRPSDDGRALVRPATNGIRDDPANHADAAPPVATPITIASGTTIHPTCAAFAPAPTACMTPWMTPSRSIGTSVSTAPVTSR